MFAVYDSAVEAFMQPFFMRSKGEALRAWQTTVNDPSTNFNKHPDDYCLFQIGEYDEISGKVTSLDTKLSLGMAIEFIAKDQPDTYKVNKNAVNVSNISEVNQ